LKFTIFIYLSLNHFVHHELSQLYCDKPRKFLFFYWAPETGRRNSGCLRRGKSKHDECFSSIGATLAAQLPVLQTEADTDIDPTGIPILDVLLAANFYLN